MQLECFTTMADPPELAPGRPDRPWMDAFGGRTPYRCLPLTMANTTGWEILCPFGFTAEWNEPVIRSLDSEPELKAQCQAWSTSRAEFNQKLTDRDPATLKESWQRFDFKAEPPARGGPAPSQHVNKRRPKTPKPKG